MLKVNRIQIFILFFILPFSLISKYSLANGICVNSTLPNEVTYVDTRCTAYCGDEFDSTATPLRGWLNNYYYTIRPYVLLGVYAIRQEANDAGLELLNSLPPRGWHYLHISTGGGGFHFDSGYGWSCYRLMASWEYNWEDPWPRYSFCYSTNPLDYEACN